MKIVPEFIFIDGEGEAVVVLFEVIVAVVQVTPVVAGAAAKAVETFLVLIGERAVMSIVTST